MSVTKKPQKVPNICDPDSQGVHHTGQESWRAFEIMAEFVEATERLKSITPAVSIFGSARTPVDHPYYKLTEEVARLLSESGFSVISGGGPVGVVTGLALARAGIRVTVFDRLPKPAEDHRAATLQPSTLDMFAKLGLWSSELHRAAGERKAFPSEFSKLGAPELSDLTARVVSDAGRVVELVGLLNGLDARMKIRLRAARAASRSKQRRDWPADQKSPTKQELDDLADEDPSVVALEEQSGLLLLLLAQSSAVRDANQMYRESLSREVSYRSAQLQARMY